MALSKQQQEVIGFLSSIAEVANIIKERIEKEETAINNHMFNDIKKIDDALDTLHYMLFESGD